MTLGTVHSAKGTEYDHVLLVSASAEPAEVDYTLLGLEDVNLGYAGLFEQDHPLHAALSRLEPGDRLTLRREEAGVALFDFKGRKLIRLSRKAEAEWQERLPAVREVRVVAVIRRSAEQDEDSERRSRYRVAEWEVPLVEVVWENTRRGECPRA